MYLFEWDEEDFTYWVKDDKRVPDDTILNELTENLDSRGLKVKGAKVPSLSMPVLFSGIYRNLLSYLRDNTEMPTSGIGLRAFDDHCRWTIYAFLNQALYDSIFNAETFMCEDCGSALVNGDCVCSHKGVADELV